MSLVPEREHIAAVFFLLITLSLINPFLFISSFSTIHSFFLCLVFLSFLFLILTHGALHRHFHRANVFQFVYVVHISVLGNDETKNFFSFYLPNLGACGKQNTTKKNGIFNFSSKLWNTDSFGYLVILVAIHLTNMAII